MAGVVIPRPRSSISVEEAEQQFDLLFDEYFKDDIVFHAQSQGLVHSTGVSPSQRGEDRLESGSPDLISGEETDEVYIPEERQAPQQVAQREAISQVAHQLRTLGDRYAEQYGGNLTVADTTLTALFTHATSLEYDTFKNTVESLTTTDRNAADFVFVMCLSRNVVSRLEVATNKAKSFFRRYIGTNYIGEMAQAGGVAEYVQQ